MLTATQFSFTITIGGREAHSFNDLDNFSKQEIWNTLENFMGVNLQLRTEVANLTIIVSQKDSEIRTLRSELAELAEMKRQLLAFAEENVYLKEQISNLNEKVIKQNSDFQMQLNILTEQMKFVQDTIMPNYIAMQKEIREHH
jgi:predicted nuclease with TOPRIM domain